jgi:hypothetical protein
LEESEFIIQDVFQNCKKSCDLCYSNQKSPILDYLYPYFTTSTSKLIKNKKNRHFDKSLEICRFKPPLLGDFENSCLGCSLNSQCNVVFNSIMGAFLETNFCFF